MSKMQALLIILLYMLALIVTCLATVGAMRFYALALADAFFIFKKINIMKDLDLKSENIHKVFLVYAIPSVIGVCVFALYTLVDCVFAFRYFEAASLVQLVERY